MDGRTDGWDAKCPEEKTNNKYSCTMQRERENVGHPMMPILEFKSTHTNTVTIHGMREKVRGEMVQKLLFSHNTMR